jgi:hypothetical protein
LAVVAPQAVTKTVVVTAATAFLAQLPQLVAAEAAAETIVAAVTAAPAVVVHP